MTQPEALRLADMLENNYPLEPEAEEAAAGLRRLHEENEQLRQALAQPEWVGVTYDEVYEFVCTTDSYIDFAKAIEAKLKEKNGA